MRAVNLLPREARPQRSFQGSGAVIVGAVAAAAVVVLALGAGYMTAHSRADSEGQKLAAAQAQLRQAQHEAAQRQAKIAAGAKHAKPIVPVPAVTAEEQPRLTAVASALSGRVAWDRVLREFSQVMPSDITVSSLTLNAPTAAATGETASGFSLQGLAFSHDSVARLLARLMLIPDLADVSLTSSSTDSGSDRVSFEIDASVKGAAPSGGAS